MRTSIGYLEPLVFSVTPFREKKTVLVLLRVFSFKVPVAVAIKFVIPSRAQGKIYDPRMMFFSQ